MTEMEEALPAAAGVGAWALGVLMEMGYFQPSNRALGCPDLEVTERVRAMNRMAFARAVLREYAGEVSRKAAA